VFEGGTRPSAATKNEQEETEITEFCSAALSVTSVSSCSSFIVKKTRFFAGLYYGEKPAADYGRKRRDFEVMEIIEQ